jgi:hypothetical protein
MHLLTDQHAMITRRRAIEGGDHEVDSFVLTSLSPNAPKVLFNVEVGDTGTIEPSRCGCAMHRVGLQTVLFGVYSFEKLTGEGMTLPGTDLLTVIEEALPARFGGSPLDYQVVEEEDDAGRTRMTLFVHPGVGVVSPDQVIDAFLGELERLRPKSSIPHIWRQAGTLRVVREAPRLTRGGKQIPFHALGSHRSVSGSPAGPAHSRLS